MNELDEEYQKGFDAAIKQFSWQTNLAEVFANPVVLAAEIQKIKDNVWTTAEWGQLLLSDPFRAAFEATKAEAYEAGEAAGFGDGESVGYERAEKHAYDGKEEAHEEGYKKGYEAAKKEFSHPSNTPHSLKGKS